MIPRSTFTTWKPSWSWYRRSGCRTTCRPRSAKGRRRKGRLFGRHQVAFAAGDGLVEDLAHRIDAGAALRGRAPPAEDLLAAGGAGVGGGADVVVADAVANADDHASPGNQFCDNANNSQERYAGVRSNASANANCSQDREGGSAPAIPLACSRI